MYPDTYFCLHYQIFCISPTLVKPLPQTELLKSGPTKTVAEHPSQALTGLKLASRM